MLDAEEILSIKLASRHCRRVPQIVPAVQDIVDECCTGLGMEIPRLICCESLARSFSSFYLRKKPHLIYDGCLIESLYIYDCILYSGVNAEDMDKLFYKVFGEELLRQGYLSPCLYFAGKYRALEFSFDTREDFDSDEVTSQLSRQIYFLVAHELAHLSLGKETDAVISDEYRKFVRSAIAVLTQRIEKQGQSIKEILKDRAGYFLDQPPDTLDEYLEMLTVSERFEHFIEECYCDFTGFKLLMEHYGDPGISVSAISSALNYLITQESIFSALTNGVEGIKDTRQIAQPTMYYSVLRVELLLITLEMNELDSIEKAFIEIHDRSSLSERLSDFLQMLPGNEAMKLASEVHLPDMDERSLMDILMKHFYYVSIS